MGGCYSAMKSSSVPGKEKQPQSKTNTLTRNSDAKVKQDKKAEANGKSSKKNQESLSPGVQQEGDEITGSVESPTTPVVEQTLYNPFQVDVKTEQDTKESCPDVEKVEIQSDSQKAGETQQNESDLINKAVLIVEETLKKSIQTTIVTGEGPVELTNHKENSGFSEVVETTQEQMVVSGEQKEVSPEQVEVSFKRTETTDEKHEAPMIDFAETPKDSFEPMGESVHTPCGETQSINHEQILAEVSLQGLQSVPCNSIIQDTEVAIHPADITEQENETEVLINSTCQSFDLSVESSPAKVPCQGESLSSGVHQAESHQDKACDQQLIAEDMAIPQSSELVEPCVPSEMESSPIEVLHQEIPLPTEIHQVESHDAHQGKAYDQQFVVEEMTVPKLSGLVEQCASRETESCVTEQIFSGAETAHPQLVPEERIEAQTSEIVKLPAPKETETNLCSNEQVSGAQAVDTQLVSEEIVETQISGVTEQCAAKEIKTELSAIEKTPETVDDSETRVQHELSSTEISETGIPEPCSNDVPLLEVTPAEIPISTPCSINDNFTQAQIDELTQGPTYTEAITDITQDAVTDIHQQEIIETIPIMVSPVVDEQIVCQEDVPVICSEQKECELEKLKLDQSDDAVVEKVEQLSDQLVQLTVESVLGELNPVECKNELISEHTINVNCQQQTMPVDSINEESLVPESNVAHCQSISETEKSTLMITGAISKDQRELWWNQGNTCDQYTEETTAPELMDGDRAQDEEETLPPPPAPEDIFYSQNVSQSEYSMPSSQDSLPLPSPPELMQCGDVVSETQLEKCCPLLEGIVQTDCEPVCHDMESGKGEAATNEVAGDNLVTDVTTQHNPSINQETVKHD